MDSHTNHDIVFQRRSRNQNIIAFRRDAAFFYERGVRYLERNDYKRALKAFRKTVECEPENPVNHCNLAGVLSELGDFEASNEILLHVLQDLDPSMAECQFYLANNYANMGEYETAEEYVLRYLDAAPDGEYAEDATEMLGVLMDEFGGGKAYARWEEKRIDDEREAAKQDGRHLLEQGQFEAAVEWLEGIAKREPENTAAWNNLSLAYYYTGQYEKAVETAEQVLEAQPENTHALCNMALFVSQLGSKEELHQYVKRLSTVFPLHYDQAMKVGTTLGLIGEHNAALFVFRRLVKLVEAPEPALLHSLAAAAANAGWFNMARKWWKVLEQSDEMADVARYYLKCLDAAVAKGKRSFKASYQYDMPLKAQFLEMKQRLNEGDLSMWRQDPLLRASLYWGLRHGTPDTHRAVIRALALLADEDAERALRIFLKRPDVDVSLQACALFAMQRCRARGRVEVSRDGELMSVRMSDIPKDVILQAEPHWLTIWQTVESELRHRQKSRQIPELKRVWIAFLQYSFLRTHIRIVKPEIWVAGLLYLGLSKSGERVRQKDIADQFHIAVSSLRKAAVRLDAFFVKMPEL